MIQRNKQWQKSIKISIISKVYKLFILYFWNEHLFCLVSIGGIWYGLVFSPFFVHNLYIIYSLINLINCNQYSGIMKQFGKYVIKLQK